MSSRHADERPGARWRHQRAWAASVLFVGLLLFAWPFVRTPALSIGESYGHLLAAWVAVIAGLGLMARSLGRGAREGGRG